MQSPPRTPFDKAHWIEEWQKPSWGNHEANLLFLDRTGLLRQGLRILEIGCGRGPMMTALRARGHNVIGVDFNETLLATWDHGGQVCVARGEQLPFAEGEFDLVMSFDVFEHIPDSDAHLREVNRVLRRPGHYVLQTPNKWTNAPTEMLNFARKFGMKHMFDCFLPPAHCSLHSFRQLGYRLRRHGFEPQFFDVPVVNEYFVEKLRRLLGTVGVSALRVLNPDRMPLSLRTNFYVAALIAH